MRQLIFFSILISSSLALAGPSAPTLGSVRSTKRVPLIKASFEKTWLRDASPDAIVALMGSAFMIVQGAPNECTSITEHNRSVLGDNNPRTGQPDALHPSAGFANWLDQCLRKMTQSENLDLAKNPRRAQLAVGSPVTKFCFPKARLATFNNNLNDCNWINIPKHLRLNSTLDLIHELIGPNEVITDLAIAQSDQWLAEKLVTYLEQNGESLVSELSLGGGEKYSVTPITAYEMTKYLILSMDIWKE